MGSRRQARELAFQTLFSYEANPRSSQELFKLDWLDPEERDQVEPDVEFFAKYLISGTLENLPEIDATISKYLKNRILSRVDRVDLAILRVSTFQMLYAKDIPKKVVIDEAVGIAKKYSSEDSYRFVNGIMDAMSKGEEG